MPRTTREMKVKMRKRSKSWRNSQQTMGSETDQSGDWSHRQEPEDGDIISKLVVGHLAFGVKNAWPIFCGRWAQDPVCSSKNRTTSTIGSRPTFPKSNPRGNFSAPRESLLHAEATDLLLQNADNANTRRPMDPEYGTRVEESRVEKWRVDEWTVRE